MIFSELKQYKDSVKRDLSIFILSLAFLSACGSESQSVKKNQNPHLLGQQSLNRLGQQNSNRIEGVILRDYYDLNYFSGRGPWSDHAPIRYGHAVVWNVAQKCQEPTDDERLEGRVANHKFLELNRSETELEYQARLWRVAGAIHEIMSSDLSIDLFLLQELPVRRQGMDSTQEIEQALQQHQLALIKMGTQGIVIRRGRSVRREFIAAEVLRELGWAEQSSSRRKIVFRLSPFCVDDLRACYVSTHGVFGDAELTADTCRVMGEISRQLGSRHRGFAVYFGGDFNRSLFTLMQQQACRDLQFQGFTTPQEHRASGASADDPDVNRNVDLWIQMHL